MSNNLTSLFIGIHSNGIYCTDIICDHFEGKFSGFGWWDVVFRRACEQNSEDPHVQKDNITNNEEPDDRISFDHDAEPQYQGRQRVGGVRPISAGIAILYVNNAVRVRVRVGAPIPAACFAFQFCF